MTIAECVDQASVDAAREERQRNAAAVYAVVDEVHPAGASTVQERMQAGIHGLHALDAARLVIEKAASELMIRNGEK